MPDNPSFIIPKPPECPAISEEIGIELPNDTEKALYEEVKNQVRFIEGKIETGVNLSKRERKIIKSRISTILGLNDSFITYRRYPKIHDFIEKENSRLEHVYNTTQKIRRAKIHKKTLTQMTKQELIFEVRLMRCEKSRSEHEVILSQVSEIIDSGLAASQHRYRIAKDAHRLQNEEYVRQIAELVDIRQALEHELSDEIDRRKALEAKIHILQSRITRCHK